MSGEWRAEYPVPLLFEEGLGEESSSHRSHQATLLPVPRSHFSALKNLTLPPHRWPRAKSCQIIWRLPGG